MADNVYGINFSFLCTHSTPVNIKVGKSVPVMPFFYVLHRKQVKRIQRFRRYLHVI